MINRIVLLTNGNFYYFLTKKHSDKISALDILLGTAFIHNSYYYVKHSCSNKRFSSGVGFPH